MTLLPSTNTRAALGRPNDKIGATGFWRDIWRQKPAIYRNYLSEHELAPFCLNNAQNLCRGDVTARIFVLSGEERDRGISRIIPEPSRAWEIYQTYRTTEKLTLLLNSVERVDARLSRLQDSFSIPFDWRRDDVVASVSTEGSGIGFHAGREDGFVLQVSGVRRWRIWGPEVVGQAHRRFFLGDDRIEPPMADRPSIEPLVDCTLEPGDVLYTPAMFAHEGETIQESVSLSLAWAGVTAYHVFASLRDLDLPSLPRELEDHLMVLIPDVLDPNARVEKTIMFLQDRFQGFGTLTPCIEELEDYVVRLLGRTSSRSQ